MTLAVFGQVHSFEFISYDDPLYVTENPLVLSGLSWGNVRWAFTHAEGLYSPLDYLGHMLACELFGMWAGGHHLLSLALHTANTLLLYVFLCKTSGAHWRSALVAALFAIHPLHVEPVVWISSQKDVLSTCFMLAALLVYADWAKRPAPRTYAILLGLYICGLLAKPMLITLPFLLLALDYWPLRRWQDGIAPTRLLLEKIPLLVPALVVTGVQFITQTDAGALRTFGEVPLLARIANAVSSYGTYLWQTVWPVGLMPFYPHPGDSYALLWPVLSGAVIIGITAAAWWLRRKMPALTAGWAWYLIALVPVCGIVPIGDHAHADRYTYVPLIGIFMAIAWLLPEPKDLLPWARATLAGALTVAIATLAVLAHAQTSRWQDDATLFAYMVEEDPGNPVAAMGLGNVHLRAGRHEKAVAQFRAVLERRPDRANAHNNLGAALAAQGKYAEAIPHYRKELEQNPQHADAHSNLGAAYLTLGQVDEALEHLERAVELEPMHADALTNLGAAYLLREEYEPAADVLDRAVQWNPGDAVAWTNLAYARYRLGHLDAARDACQRALELDPDYPQAKRLMAELGPGK